MTTLAALFTSCLAVSVTCTAQTTCQNTIHCPCGSSGRNVTVCIQTADGEPCKKWSRCKTCKDGLDNCLQCPEGLEGPFCSEEISQKKSRQKRQYAYRPYGRNPQRPGNRPMQSSYQRSPAQQNSYPTNQGAERVTSCPNLESPKGGSIRCFTVDQHRTCTGTCLPGYTFQNHDSEEEMTLTCERGAWTPFSTFPDCLSGGYCELIVKGVSGTFNCTTGISGTRCDVNCRGRFAGRYYCYPEHEWNPPLPYCVRAKEVPRHCHCDHGETCDSHGHCMCPAGWTGEHCETRLSEQRTCDDPGFISKGFRRNTDGSMANTIQRFREGQSVVYGCTSEEYALQGSSLRTCKNDGTWSSSLPKCIKPPVTQEVLCPDPGQVANAERLNSDGSSSPDVQQYREGDFVTYNCLPGYVIQGRTFITCLASGVWSGWTPYCTRVMPSPLIRTTTERPVSGLKFCRDPGADPNGSRQPRSPSDRRGFPQGSWIEYSCNLGYVLNGEQSIFCLTSGGWSASRPICESQSRNPDTGGDPSDNLAYCLNPGPVANGQVLYYPSINNRRRGSPQPVTLDEPEYPEGSRLDYSCNSGYTLQGRDSIFCEKYGVWSYEPPVCRRDSSRIRYCANPGRIRNGRVVYLPTLNERRTSRPGPEDESPIEYPQGGRLQYSCNFEYILQGTAILTCQNSGQWSDSPPTCVSVSSSNLLYCDNPGPILNGRTRSISPSASGSRGVELNTDDGVEAYPEGTRLEFLCDEGYEIEGSSSMTCQAAGLWSSTPPTCVGECGRSFLKTSRRILNGERTVSGEWPWVVAISIQGDNSSRLICGGAVLNSRTVITAAHCLIEANSFILRFGKFHRRASDDDAEVLVRRSTRVIINPDFRNTTLDSDIGLVMFEPRIRFSVRVQPICLPTAESTAKDLMTGKKGYVTGWGITERNLQSDELLLASLPVVSDKACLESYRRQNMTLPLTRNMFCAGYANAQQSACSGDSGSPLVFFDSLGEKFILEGLVSYGVQGQCGLPGRYTIFTKVFQFLPWIFRNLL